MAKYGIYIQTRGRTALLVKLLPKWFKASADGGNGADLYLVVEPDELKQHKKMLNSLGHRADCVKLLSLPEPNLGIGASRLFAIRHALAMDYNSMISSDDDCYPRLGMGSGPMGLLVEACLDQTFGVGGYFSIYDFMGGLKANSGVQPMTSGMGFRLFALNMTKVRQLSGDGVAAIAKFVSGEDHELARIGIANFGIPWRVHTGVPLVSVGKRGEPGGMQDLLGGGKQARDVSTHVAHNLAYARWSNYMSNPAKCEGDNGELIGKCKYRMQWKKFINDNC